MALSTTSNKDLMTQARDSLRGQWTTPVLLILAWVVFIGLTNMVPVLAQSLLVQALVLLISGPIQLSFAYFYLTLVREQKTDTTQIKQGFNHFLPALLTYLLMFVFIFLWSLLLIIPGIIAAYSYAVAFYVLRDNPELSAPKALARSKALMMGNRWKLFCLGCRFIGWSILAILSLGIGIFWLIPYMQTAMVSFYEDLLRSETET